MIRLTLAAASVLLAGLVCWSGSPFGGERVGAMSPDVESAICGAVDDPLPIPPEPWGHKCDRTRSCQACFFSGANCYGCTSAKSYKLCGTPANELCDNGTHTVDCGSSKKYQTAGSAAECETCVGAGTDAGDCSKNSCAKDLV